MQAYHLTSEGVQSYLRAHELPLRASHYGQKTAEKIIRKGGFVGSVLEHHQAMGRTMEHARSHIDRYEDEGRSVASGTLFIADTLRDSKGRFVRKWHAPHGGLWGSVIYVSTLLPETRLLLPLAVGVACCETYHDIGVAEAEIRWINDVLIGTQKAAGILLEGFYGPVSKEAYNLIGFGLNVNNIDFPHELKNNAVSAREVLGGEVDLKDFSYRFITKLIWNLGLLIHGEDLQLEAGETNAQRSHPILQRWSQLSSSIGRRVRYGFDVITSPQYEAIVTGISSTGGLTMRLDDGSQTTEYTGEIRYL